MKLGVKLVRTKEDIVECLEALKGDAPLCSLALELVRHDLDHLLLLLLGDVRRVE